VVRVGEKVPLGFRAKPRRQTSPGGQISWVKLSTASHTEDEVPHMICIEGMQVRSLGPFSHGQTEECATFLGEDLTGE
jgi:hypothetical protein